MGNCVAPETGASPLHLLDLKELAIKCEEAKDSTVSKSPFVVHQDPGVASGFTAKYELRKQIGHGDQGSVYK